MLNTYPVPHHAAITIITGEDYTRALAHEVRSAERSIIASAYIIRAAHHHDTTPFRDLWTALAEAPQRLNECRIAINQKFPGPERQRYNTAAAAILAAAGWQVRLAPPPLIAHTKLWIFDHSRVLLGSSNVADDQRHPTANLNLLIDAHALALRVLSAFNPQWSELSPFHPDPAHQPAH